MDMNSLMFMTIGILYSLQPSICVERGNHLGFFFFFWGGGGSGIILNAGI